MIATPCPATDVQLIKGATAAYPASANATNADLVVHVDVTVGPDGSVQSARITHGSGQPDADKAALAAARASRYAPASRACAPVTGHYAYTATFVAPVTKSSEFPPRR
jgi:TonB family protein